MSSIQTWLNDFDHSDHSDGWRCCLELFIFNPIRVAILLPPLLVLTLLLFFLHPLVRLANFSLKYVVRGIDFLGDNGPTQESVRAMSQFSMHMTKDEVVKIIGWKCFRSKGRITTWEGEEAQVYEYIDTHGIVPAPYLFCFINGQLQSWGWESILEIRRTHNATRIHMSENAKIKAGNNKT